MIMKSRLPLHSIVLLAVVLIVATLQIPYLFTLNSSSSSYDLFALPSNLTLDSFSVLPTLQNVVFGLKEQNMTINTTTSTTTLLDPTSESLEEDTAPKPNSTAADADADLGRNSSWEILIPPKEEPYCYNTTDRSYCCAKSWHHDLDSWWQHHPDWEPSLENDTNYCFSPIENIERATLLRNTVYPNQWGKHNHQGSCRNQTYAHMMINSGYSANIGLLGRSFLTASMNNKTFVASRKKPNFIWRYANRNGTGVCPTSDMECYFLPTSPCKAELGQHEGFDKDLVDDHGGNYGASITFLRNYLVRPKLWLRWRVYELLRDVKMPSQPCTVMHVRRTDVVLEGNWRKARHYFAIADYLKEVQDSEVLLVTDDQTAIDEALEFHGKEKNWTFLKRKRWRGTEGGMNGHLPSGDPTLEVAFILAEQRLASHCHKLVHTRSGFADVLLQAMQVKQWDIEAIRIDVGRQPNATHFVTAEQFFEKVQARRNATTNSSTVRQR